MKHRLHLLLHELQLPLLGHTRPSIDGFAMPNIVPINMAGESAIDELIVSAILACELVVSEQVVPSTPSSKSATSTACTGALSSGTIASTKKASSGGVEMSSTFTGTPLQAGLCLHSLGVGPRQSVEQFLLPPKSVPEMVRLEGQPVPRAP